MIEGRVINAILNEARQAAPDGRCGHCMAPFNALHQMRCDYCGTSLWCGGGMFVDPIHERVRGRMERHLALLLRQPWPVDAVIEEMLRVGPQISADGTRLENWSATAVSVMIDAGMGAALSPHEQRFPTPWDRARRGWE